MRNKYCKTLRNSYITPFPLKLALAFYTSHETATSFRRQKKAELNLKTFNLKHNRKNLDCDPRQEVL